LGFIDPENIDEDVGDNEDGEVLGEDAFDEDVDVVDGVQISSSPNRNKLHTSPKQKSMAKLKRFMNLHGNSRQPSPMEGVDQGAYDILMAPHSQDPPNLASTLCILAMELLLMETPLLLLLRFYLETRTKLDGYSSLNSQRNSIHV
jgi:hypothetical protein